MVTTQKTIENNQTYFQTIVARATRRCGSNPSKSEVHAAIIAAMEEEQRFEEEMIAGTSKRAKKARQVLAEDIFSSVHNPYNRI